MLHARSWHLSISAAYFPAWVLVSIIFHQFIFKATNAGLLIILYILTGLSLASWTYLVAAPFAHAPTLAAISCEFRLCNLRSFSVDCFVATFLAIILAIGALLSPSNVGSQILLTLIFPPMFFTFFTKGLSAWETVPSSPNILKTGPKGDAPILALLVVAIVSHQNTTPRLTGIC